MKRNEIVVLTFAGIVLIFASLILIFGFSFIGCKNQSSGGSISDDFTSDNNIVKDIDGNTYDIVQMGNQVWMKSNLRSTHYADGTPIEMAESYKEKEPKYCKDEKTGEVYYNGYAASLKICPKGWHVSSLSDWKQLEDYLIRNGYSCGAKETQVAKSLASDEGWDEYSTPCTPGYNSRTTNNATGFSAKPLGYFQKSDPGFPSEYGEGSLVGVGWDAQYWPSEEVDEHEIPSISGSYRSKYLINISASEAIIESYEANAAYFNSVRCVRDE